MLSENERLTHERNSCSVKPDNWSKYWTAASKGQLMERLAAYENTGFSVDELQRVARCNNCEYCCELNDESVPYKGGSGRGFYCSKHDVAFYAPFYDVTRHFCAEGKKKSWR